MLPKINDRKGHAVASAAESHYYAAVRLSYSVSIYCVYVSSGKQNMSEKMHFPCFSVLPAYHVVQIY